MKKSLIFYYEWLTLINSLPNSQRLQFYDTLFSENRKIKNTNIHLKSVYDFVIKKIEENEEKYANKVAKLRVNASKGGKASSKSKQLLPKAKQFKQIERVNVNVNDNVNDKKEYTKEKHLEFVYLTKKQYEDLVWDFGESSIKSWIEKLNNYIADFQPKYKSHSHTIRRWIRKEIENKINSPKNDPFLKVMKEAIKKPGNLLEDKT